jgi:hypothetical protein
MSSKSRTNCCVAWMDGGEDALGSAVHSHADPQPSQLSLSPSGCLEDRGRLTWMAIDFSPEEKALGGTTSIIFSYSLPN